VKQRWHELTNGMDRIRSIGMKRIESTRVTQQNQTQWADSKERASWLTAALRVRTVCATPNQIIPRKGQPLDSQKVRCVLRATTRKSCTTGKSFSCIVMDTIPREEAITNNKCYSIKLYRTCSQLSGSCDRPDAFAKFTDVL
jgi:hypothetical protein